MELEGTRFEYLDLTERLPYQERSQYFDDRVAWVVEHAYKNAPSMKDILDKAGISPSQIRCVNDLQKIPITNKDDFIKAQRQSLPFGGFLGVPSKDIRRIYISPGPVYYPEGFGFDRWRQVARMSYTAGFRKGDRIVNTFAHQMVPIGLWVIDALAALGVTVLPTGTQATEIEIRIIKELEATGFWGFPGYLNALIAAIEQAGYDFHRDFSIHKACIGGEIFTPSRRRVLEEDYGINITQGYGFAEVGVMGWECEQKSGMHIDEEYIIEVVDPVTGKNLEPGEVGECVVTHINDAYPLIRYGSGDLVSFTDEPCPCGRTSPRILRVFGRVGEAVKTRGMFIYPKEADEAILKLSEISNYQMVVTRSGHRDEITCKVELSSEGVGEDKLSQAIIQSFKDVCHGLKIDKIEFVAKGTIPEMGRKVADERTWEE